MSCPMTVGACEEYGITPNQQKAFCARGCSVICEEEFRKLCEKQLKKAMCKNVECPYHRVGEECPATQGCGGYSD